MIQLLFIVTLLLSSPLFAQEKLIVIKDVSTGDKSFMVAHGASDGVFVGQRALFATTEVSLTAKVVEVNRQYSVWEPEDENLKVPFKREQIVTFNHNPEGIWTEMPKLTSSYEPYTFSPEHFWIFRGALSYALTETVSDAAADRRPVRTGIQVEALYAKQINTRFDWGLGIRVDSENAEQADPSLTIPTLRFFGIGEVIYHFEPLQGSNNNFYLGLAIGIGRSQTEVAETVSAGLSYVLPSFRIGFLRPMSDNYAFLLEGAIEGIHSQESFEDESAQSTTIINSKISFGVRF